MQFFKDHFFAFSSILIVALAIVLKVPLIFSLLLIPLLVSLRVSARRYYILAIFIFLGFYGSYTLFNIEPLFAPQPIKIGKDAIWLVLLLAALPFLDWKRLTSFPKTVLLLAAIFSFYILSHALIINHDWQGKALEIRDYLEYLPLAFIPGLLINKVRDIQQTLIDFLLIGTFIALFALLQDKIPGISVLGGYRVNSTLPNFFHMAMFLNTFLVLAVATFVRFRDKLNKKIKALMLILMGLLTYSSFLSDSRGFDLALVGSLILVVVLLWPVWKKSWLLLIPSAVAILAFFTVGPYWASSRFSDLATQFTHPFVTQSHKTTTKTNVVNTVQQNLSLINKESKNKNEKDFTVSHSSDSSVATRAFNIHMAFDEVKASPIIGHGMLLKNSNPSTAYATDFFLVDSIVHLGLLGSSLFFALIGSFLIWITKIYLRHPTKKEIVTLLAFIGIICQFLVSAFTTSSWIAFPVNALFWLYVGLASALVIFYSSSNDSVVLESKKAHTKVSPHLKKGKS